MLFLKSVNSFRSQNADLTSLPVCRWVVYQEPNYRGPHYILEKRDYNNFSDWGSQNNTVGSMRRVRFN